MTETGLETTVEDGGTLEIVRVPAWEVKFKHGQDPDELAHAVCCRDLDWRKALCGYEETGDPVIMSEAKSICTMCVEAAGGVDGRAMTERRCPVDDQPCPDDDEVDRLIAERTSRP
jgi:hypothetical protein